MWSPWSEHSGGSGWGFSRHCQCVCMVHRRSAPWLSTESQIESPWTRVCNSLFLKESVPVSHTQQHSLVLDLGQSKTYNMLLTGDCFQGKRNTQTESEMKEIIFHANGNNKKARVAIPLSGKIDFKKSKKKDKNQHYIMIKGSTEEVTALLNIRTPDIVITYGELCQIHDLGRKEFSCRTKDKACSRRDFVYQSFITVEKGQRTLLTQTSEVGRECPTRWPYQGLI